MAGDANLNRYVGNGPTQYIDPWGLAGGPEGPSTPRELNEYLKVPLWLRERFALQELTSEAASDADQWRTIESEPSVDIENGHPQFTNDQGPKVDENQKAKLKRLKELKDLGLRHQHSKLDPHELRRLRALYNSFQDPRSPDSLNPLKSIFNMSDADWRVYIGNKQYEVYRNPSAFEYRMNTKEKWEFFNDMFGKPKNASSVPTTRYHYHP